MKEFIIFDSKMNKVDEEEAVVKACRWAYINNGFVGVVDIKTGNIKEIIQGKTLKYLSNK